jgi:hypothetical protein
MTNDGAPLDESVQSFISGSSIVSDDIILLPEEAAIGVTLHLYDMTLDQVVHSERCYRITRERIRDKDINISKLRAFLPSRFRTHTSMMMEPLGVSKEKFNKEYAKNRKPGDPAVLRDMGKLNIMSAIVSHGMSLLQHQTRMDFRELKKLKRHIWEVDAPAHDRIWGRQQHLYKQDVVEESMEFGIKRVVVRKLPVDMFVHSFMVAAPLGELAEFLAVSSSELVAPVMAGSILTWSGNPSTAVPMFQPDTLLVKNRLKEVLEQCIPYMN